MVSVTHVDNNDDFEQEEEDELGSPGFSPRACCSLPLMAQGIWHSTVLAQRRVLHPAMCTRNPVFKVGK